MRSLILLLSVYFLIYSSNVFIDRAVIDKLRANYTIEANICLECFTGLVGGLLAAFVLPAYILFTFSILGLIIGCTSLEWLIENESYTGFWFSITVFSLSIGLFKFIFIVMLLDQKSSIKISNRIIGWALVHNVCYVIVYAFVAINAAWANKIIGSFVMTVAVVLLIVGKWKRIYNIESNKMDIIEISRNFKKTNGILDIRDQNSVNVIVSISKATLIFLQLLPYGFCSSQVRFAYVYQSSFMRQPNMTGYAPFKRNFFPAIIDGLTIVVVLLIILSFKYLKLQWFAKFNSKIKLKIVLGVILMIISTMIGGIVEFIRLGVFYGRNDKTTSPVHSFNQTIEGIMYQAADMSVFYMTPQIFLASISRVLVVLTCIEYIYSESVSNVKYLSVAFFLSAVSKGGIGDLLSIGIYYCQAFNATNLNERIPKDGTNECCQYQSRLDHVLYILSSLAALSLVVSLIFMKKFKAHFKVNTSNTETNSILEDIDPSEH